MSNSRPSRRWTLEATRRPQPGPRAGTPRQAPHFRAASQGPAGTAAARGQRQAAAAILPAALGGASCRPVPPSQGQPAQGTADGRVRNLHLCHARALPLGLCLPGRLHNSACHGHCPCRPPVPMSPHLHPPQPSLRVLPYFLLGPLAIRCNGTPYRMIRRSCQPGKHGCTDVSMPWPGGAGSSGSPSQTLLTDYAHLRLPMPMPRPLAAWPATPELICPPKASAPPLRSPAHGPATCRMLPEHMFLPPCRNTLGQAPGCNPETIACHAGVPETMPRHALAHVGPATLGGGQAGRPGN